MIPLLRTVERLVSSGLFGKEFLCDEAIFATTFEN